MRNLLIAAALGVLGFLHWSNSRPLDPGPGAVAPRAPVQRDADRGAPITHGEFTLTPLARLEGDARVLGREDYRFGTEAALSPTDLALGWGRMSDAGVLAGLDISQGGRWYHYRWQGPEPPIPLREIAISSANMHIIPASDAVAAQLDRVREGHVVRFSGLLVEASRADGWRWRSSLTREDTGGGACEVVWLERLELR